MFRSVATNFASLPSALQKGEWAGGRREGKQSVFWGFLHIVFIGGLHFPFPRNKSVLNRSVSLSDVEKHLLPV